MKSLASFNPHEPGTETGDPNKEAGSTISQEAVPTSTNGPGSSGSPNHDKSGLSAAVIAVIVLITALLMIFLVVFGIRTWHRQRRGRRIRRWVSWRRKAKALGSFGLVAVAEERDTATPESSFSRTERITPSVLESVGQIRSGYSSWRMSSQSSLSSLGAPVQAESATHRFSGGSSQFSFVSDDTESSSNSNARASTASSAQYIAYPALQPDNIGNQLSPISVSPWTPSERWQFPKPPRYTNGIPSSETGPPSPATSDSDKTIRGESSNPFEDPPSTSSVSVSRHDSVLSMARSDSAAFSDMAESRHTSLMSTTCSELSAVTSASDSLAGIVDIIKRKFTQNCGDELTIIRGDRICILRRFDDGWLYVEKTSTKERGFIPQDCLREADQLLPVYLTRRASALNTCAV